MHRRDVMKTLAAVLSIPILDHLSPMDLLAFGRETHARLQDSHDEGRHIFKTLDPHQNRTVAEVTELIIPQTDTPGATEARVNEFIDLILTEWFSTEERDHFLKGLVGLDRESRRIAGGRFADCDQSQQVQLLEAQEKAAILSRSGLSRDEMGWGTSPQSLVKRHFFDIMKWLTLFGYYTSEVGMKEETGFRIVHASFSGCVPLIRE